MRESLTVDGGVQFRCNVGLVEVGVILQGQRDQRQIVFTIQ
jgi:hypothetical protein